jgi:hypothetical protein
LKLSVYEKEMGIKEEHYAIVTNEVNLYSPDRTSGDACRVIQKLGWGDIQYLRLGYYVRNPETKKWRWGQSTPIIEEEELRELFKRAVKEKLINSVI